MAGIFLGFNYTPMAAIKISTAAHTHLLSIRHIAAFRMGKLSTRVLCAELATIAVNRAFEHWYHLHGTVERNQTLFILLAPRRGRRKKTRKFSFCRNLKSYAYSSCYSLPDAHIDDVNCSYARAFYRDTNRTNSAGVYISRAVK